MDISRKIAIYLALFLGTSLMLSFGVLSMVEDHKTHIEHRDRLKDLQHTLTELEHSADEPPRSWNSTRVETIGRLVETVATRSNDLALQERYQTQQETIQKEAGRIATTWEQFEALDQMEGRDEPVQQHKDFLQAIERAELETRSLDTTMSKYGTDLMHQTSLLVIALIITLLGDVLISRYLFRRRITGPIESLTDVVNRISKGETDVEIDMALKERDDEIGRLARSFERTMTSLKLAMERSAPILEEKNRSLKEIVEEKRKAETELEETITTLNTTLNCVDEGILVVAPDGSVLHNNQQFQEMWNMPDELMEEKDDKKLLEHAKEQLKNPEKFQERVEELYSNPEGQREDTIEFRDDRRFKRIFKPLRTDETLIGWAWIFKDISEREEPKNER